MNRPTVIGATLWAALTAVGELAVLNTDVFPATLAVEAEIVDEAFDIFMALGVPVFALVVATLVYGVIRFRSSGPPEGDGPPVHNHSPWTASWLVWAAALTVLVIVHPGHHRAQRLTHQRCGDAHDP